MESYICGLCRYFENDARVIERELPGLIILSSAYGDTRGTQGFCLLSEQLLTEKHRCSRFEPVVDRPPASGGGR